MRPLLRFLARRLALVRLMSLPGPMRLLRRSAAHPAARWPPAHPAATNSPLCRPEPQRPPPPANAPSHDSFQEWLV